MPAVPDRKERQKLLDSAINSNGAEMRALLLKARDRIDLKILRAAEKGNLASAAWLRDTLYADLAKEYQALQGDLSGWVRNSTETIAKDWTRLAVKDIPAAGPYEKAWATFSNKYLDATVASFSPATMAGRAAVNAPLLDPALGGMLKNDIDTVRKVVMDTSRLQAATGMTAQEWRRTVKDEITKERPAWTFIDKSGKTWATDNYFNMLNRTLAANVSREAYQDTMAESGHDLATIEGGIPPNCCQFCLKWAGKIVSVSGSSDKFPSLAEAEAEGVFHPRCRHYLAVVLPGEEKEAKDYEEKMREDAAEKGFPLTNRQVQPNDVEPEKVKEVKAPELDPADAAIPKLEAIDADRIKQEAKLDVEVQKIQAEWDAMAAKRTAELNAVQIPAGPLKPMTPGESPYYAIRLKYAASETEFNKRFSEAAAKVTALREQKKNEMREVFLRPKSEAAKITPQFNNKILNTSERRAVIDPAIEFTSRFWDPEITNGKTIQFYTEPGANRASFSETLGVKSPKNMTSSVGAHELAHWTEHLSPDYHNAAVSFQQKRNAGGVIESLRKLHPGSNYDDHEITVTQNWKGDDYAGKIYLNGSGTKAWNEVQKSMIGKVYDPAAIPELNSIRATEVLSQATGSLYANPLAFQKKDPDFFRFIVNLAARGAP